MASLAVVVGLAVVSACSSGQTIGTSSTAALTASTTTGMSATNATSPTTETVAVPSTIVATTAVVPANYNQLYANLSTNLDAYQAAISAMPPATTASPVSVAGAELLPANGNRLKGLLDSTTLPAVDAWLDRFHALGINGVTLGIKVPMLLSRFGTDAAAYTDFYATVADHARSRGMTVVVELGALFCGTAYAACTSPFDGSYKQFVADTVAQSRIVIDRVKPDNLDILSEPTTEASLAGVNEFETPSGVETFVHDVLTGVGDRRSTKIGAGAASWLSSAYDEAILKEDVDFLVMHIYPINAKIAKAIVTDTSLAQRAHKPIVADEVGLYKTDEAGVSGTATADSVYRLDKFSFFEPLDIRFITITAEWARKAGVTYLSPFWAGQFFAYLPWTNALDAMKFAALDQTANQAIAAAFRANEVTTYGQSWPAVLLG